jgi:hypothetical protein
LQESCPTLNVTVVEIPPQSQLIQALGAAASQPPGSGMLVLGPFYPLKTTQDLRGIPTITPWQPGDPTREVPEGAVAPFFSALDTDLEPGTYRLEFRYLLERYTDVVQTVYSQPFQVKSAEPASGP